jgi:hypothetical protein
MYVLTQDPIGNNRKLTQEVETPLKYASRGVATFTIRILSARVCLSLSMILRVLMVDGVLEAAS